MGEASRVLVIDDSLTVRKLVEIAFQPSGLALDFAATGRAGVDRAVAATPDLILLDYVLPDMRAPSICKELSRAPSASRTPIVLMSGKGEGVASEFQAYPSVVGYLGKPFTPEQIVRRVTEVLLGAGAGVPSRNSTMSLSGSGIPMAGTEEAAARAVYARLRAGLAELPALTQRLGAAATPAHLAKHLLTRETMSGILSALAPFHAANDNPALAGDLALVPPAELLRTIGATGRSGELTVTDGGRRLRIWLRAGVPVWATDDEGQGEGQTHERSLDVLVSLMALGSGRFAWHELPALPAWVDSHGRPAPIRRLVLERARRDRSFHEIEDRVPSLDFALERGPGFARRVAELPLDADERRVLALCDGKRLIIDICEKAELPVGSTLAILRRLIDAGLLRRRGSAALRRSGEPPLPRSVVVLDRDVEGFVHPLEALLGRRPEPLRVKMIDDPNGLAPLCKDGLRLAILNVAVFGEPALAAARVAAALGDHRPALAALLETSAGADQRNELLRAGFDTVLTKPVHADEIEALL